MILEKKKEIKEYMHDMMSLFFILHQKRHHANLQDKDAAHSDGFQL